MAITSLARRPAEDNTDTTGNIVNSSEVWILQLSDTPASTVLAYNFLDSSASIGFGFPRRGGSHADLTSLLMVSYSVSHKDEQKSIFTVNVEYTNDRQITEQDGSSDPLDVPTDYDYQQVDRQVTVEIDQITGDPIQLTNGEPILGITENKPLTRVVITRNEQNYDNRDAEQFRNKVNSSPVRVDGYTYDIGTAKMELFAGNLQLDQDGNEYYIVTYTVLINIDGFARNIVNRGGKDINGTIPNTIIASTRDGAANLDGEGEFLAKGDAPIILTFNTLGEEDFNSLRL